MPDSERVLVTDGNARAALAVARSLGRQGHQVFVGTHRSGSLAGASRYITEELVYPNPQQAPDEFVASIDREIRRLGIDTLIPVTEITTLLCTAHRETFPDTLALPFARYDGIARASDKAAVLTLAETLGVPTPRTRIVNNTEEAGDVAAWTYPVVIKPARSRVLVDGVWHSTAVSYAADATELSVSLAAKPAAEFPLLLQERIVGPGVGIFLCRHHDHITGVFSHRRLREKPPSGGVSVLRESIEPDPTALRHGEALLAALDWQGVAMVEFKRCNTSGELKLMEINGRLWGSLQLAIDAGVDFPRLLLALADGKVAETPPAYRAGVQTRWLWGDVDALLMRLMKSDTALNLPEDAPSRIRTVLNFLRLFGRDLNYEVLDLHDLRPWLRESWRWFADR